MASTCPVLTGTRHSALHHVNEDLGVTRVLDFSQEARNPDLYVYYPGFLRQNKSGGAVKK